ncbi:MAG: 5-deoxy-glucuronate isomerase [Bacteroidota bacterium]
MSREVVFRNIAGKKGRTLAVTPATAQTEFLSVGRIILDNDVPSVKYSSEGNEISYFCFNGSATVTVDAQTYTMGKYDGMYIPRDSMISVSTDSSVDLLESSAPVSKKYSTRFIAWDAIKDDPKFHASIGPETMHRELYQVIGEHIEAGRLLVGPTFSNKGNWTSWPPHEHRETLEEVYAYFDMPAPAFGIQLAYNDTKYPDVMFPVRENDAVVVHHGYHPNVAIPGHSINFVWILCAKKETADRKWGVVNVQPEYKP